MIDINICIYIYNTYEKNIISTIYTYIHRYYIHSKNARFHKEYKHLASANAGNLIKTMVTPNKQSFTRKNSFPILHILVQAPQRDQQPRSMCPWILKAWPEIGNKWFFW